MCNCIVSSRGFRLRAFYECKDVHGTYILYSQTIMLLLLLLQLIGAVGRRGRHSET